MSAKYNDFKSNILNTIAKEYQCSIEDSLECIGENEIKRLWRESLYLLPKNTMTEDVAIDYVKMFGYLNFATTFRGLNEQLINIDLRNI